MEFTNHLASIHTYVRAFPATSSLYLAIVSSSAAFFAPYLLIHWRSADFFTEALTQICNGKLAP